jgi:UDPglucose 6-dehydrogenase
MVKYTANCFLATKVSFANEIKQITDSLELNYDEVIRLATLDKRLGNSHWQVPGPMVASDGSGRYLPGFSGSCFIKDINALINVAKSSGVSPTVLQAAWHKNVEVRPERDWEALVGRAISNNEESK